MSSLLAIEDRGAAAKLAQKVVDALGFPNAYTLSKNCCEKLVADWHEGRVSSSAAAEVVATVAATSSTGSSPFSSSSSSSSSATHPGYATSIPVLHASTSTNNPVTFFEIFRNSVFPHFSAHPAPASLKVRARERVFFLCFLFRPRRISQQQQQQQQKTQNPLFDPLLQPPPPYHHLPPPYRSASREST